MPQATYVTNASMRSASSFTFCDMAKILHVVYDMWFIPLNCKIVCYLLQLYQSICIALFLSYAMCNIETNSCQSSQPQFSSWNDPGRQTAHHLGIPNLCAAANGKTTHPTRWGCHGMSWVSMSQVPWKEWMLHHHPCMIGYTPIKRAVGTWQWVCHGKGFAN